MRNKTPHAAKGGGNKIFAGLAAVLILNWGVFGIPGQELSGDEIIHRANDLMNVDNSHAKIQMTIETTSGSKRTFVYEAWSKNRGEKNLMRYLEPSRVKGQAVLMLNHSDDIWMYFPRTQRVRKLATHAKKQKMQGSDFSYEDMGSGDAFINDFEARRLEDEKMENEDCFKLELTRKEDSDISYSRLIIWIIKENYVPLIIDYYDEENPELRLKRLVQSDIRMIDGIPTATRVVMNNFIDNTQTVLEMNEIKYRIDLDDSMFTERNLKE